MTDRVFGLTKRAVERTALTVRRDHASLPREPRVTRRVYDGGTGGGGCDIQNAIIDIIVFGSPTGGTFDLRLTVNAVAEVLTFDYNFTTTQVATELATHTELASSDVSVSSLGTFPDATMRIEFTGTQANTNITLPTTDWSALTGGTGIGIICVMAQLGHA